MENISRKLELFGQGLISDNTEIIDYNEELKDSCHNFMTTYWTVDREFYYQFITDADISGVLYPPAPGPEPDFDMEDYVVTSGDIEDQTGIDFEVDYGITGDFITGLVADINTTVMDVTGSFSTSVSGLTGIYPVDENTESDGIMGLQQILSVYMDNNDTNIYYNDNLDIVLDTSSITFSKTELAIVKPVLLAEFIRSGQYKLVRRVQYNVANEIMFSKLDEISVQQICTDKIPLYTSKTSDEGRRIGVALNDLMPTDDYIYEFSTQWELLKTAKSLIDEMDVAITAMQNKGYPV